MNINNLLNSGNHMLELDVIMGAQAKFSKAGFDLVITLPDSQRLTYTNFFAQNSISYASGNSTSMPSNFPKCIVFGDKTYTYDDVITRVCADLHQEVINNKNKYYESKGIFKFAIDSPTTGVSIPLWPDTENGSKKIAGDGSERLIPAPTH